MQVVKSLGEELPKQMARVRDEVMPHYLELERLPGVNVKPALRLMRASLDDAAKAMAEGDIAAMMRAYESLKGYET